MLTHPNLPPRSRFLCVCPSHLGVFPDLTCKYVLVFPVFLPHPRSGIDASAPWRATETFAEE